MLKLLWTAPLSAKVGVLAILAYAFVALFAPLLAPYGETAIVGSSYELWSDKFVFGTDNIGRDMLTRLIYGARNTIGIAFLTVAIAFFVGGTLGMLAAILGGAYDMLIGRLVDILMAIPSLVFALLLLTVFGTSIPSLVLIIALLDSTRVFRIARSAAMNVVVMEFVEAARLRGEGMGWIIRKEVLPNITAPLLAEFGLRFCFVFLFIAALSFLGLGIQPPLADWGSMVRETATLINYNDITPLLPAIAIAGLTVAVNFVVDWMLHLSSGLRSDSH
ncbi:MAG: ABC transporter permease [Proteobacteria bacterium]|jgi:peptide/nickel transport system permease protein|nr:ABC transporter permease [Pseudomonadota bacterium]MBT5227520.1 ABC transporter permease [Pseudomonadota bacterium]MBT5819805.1 ABC transporter permease [Pseudomonadota bacterium]MBT6347719.1 ABC transporter permease [Pseudomonadota bacterium]